VETPRSGCAGSSFAALLGIALLFYQPWLGILILTIALSRMSWGSSTASSNSGKRFSFWSFLLLGLACWWMYSLWRTNTTAFYILLFASLLHLFALISNQSIWRIITGLILGLTMIGLSFLLLASVRQLVPKEDNKKSSVRTEDPVPIPVKKPGDRDSLYQHHMAWTDFTPREFLGSYPTTLANYKQSLQFHSAIDDMEIPADENKYWSNIYSMLANNDAKKMDSLINVFQSHRLNNNLSAYETAEMVVSYIQQIPYYLVHSETCQQAVMHGNDFMRQYHFDGRPCLPEVVAGVQSPYEFSHNLKGDCDTRSLLAFTVLSALDIPCSVWVSGIYGHSVVGIGIAAGGGNFKYVNGVRHFGTELTAQGYRLGMLAPDQTDMDNWTIAISKNF
jgi:hypothetical protein